MTGSIFWASPFFGLGSVSLAMTLAAFGSCYGICKSGVGISSACANRPELILRALMPVIMASMLAIYGLVVAIMINVSLTSDGTYEFFKSCIHLSAALSTGFGAIGSGYAIGEIGHVGAYAYALNQRLFLALIILLVFSELIGLYGLITGIVLITHANS